MQVTNFLPLILSLFTKSIDFKSQLTCPIWNVCDYILCTSRMKNLRDSFERLDTNLESIRRGVRYLVFVARVMCFVALVLMLLAYFASAINLKVGFVYTSPSVLLREDDTVIWSSLLNPSYWWQNIASTLRLSQQAKKISASSTCFNLSFTIPYDIRRIVGNKIEILPPMQSISSIPMQLIHASQRAMHAMSSNMSLVLSSATEKVHSYLSTIDQNIVRS